MREPVAGAPIFTSAPRKPQRIASELHGRCIRQRFTAARDRGLDQPPEEQADVTDDQHDSRSNKNERNATAFLAALRPCGASRSTVRASQRNNQQPEQQSHQSHVQAHVAVENVTELVRDHTLQFGAIQRRERTARHRDRGIGRIVARQRER